MFRRLECNTQVCYPKATEKSHCLLVIFSTRKAICKTLGTRCCSVPISEQGSGVYGKLSLKEFWNCLTFAETEFSDMPFFSANSIHSELHKQVAFSSAEDSLHFLYPKQVGIQMHMVILAGLSRCKGVLNPVCLSPLD